VNPSLFSKTPAVTVSASRGDTVRHIAYHRHPDAPGSTEECINRHAYDPRGFPAQVTDPRLHDAGLVNFTYQSNLAGTVLRTVSVDAGTTVALNDAAGRPLATLSSIRTGHDGTDEYDQAVARTWQYEDAGLPGRPLAVCEAIAGEVPIVAERFRYADNTPAQQALNLSGQCISHYDTAGLSQTDSLALTGVPISVTRRLLKDADNPDTVADWRSTESGDLDELLAAEAYVTQTFADATGTVLTTTDAAGNIQHVAYDVAAMHAGSWLTLKGDKQQVIIQSLIYTAAGQKLREQHGNGVVTTYNYEPRTQRLASITTQRPASHPSGARVLQDLRYEYDPVDNVLGISNQAEETRFWRNRKVVPENTYRYDSLYQLASATGREMANAGQQSSSLPPATVPLPADSSTFTPYTRTYTYDRGGNLTRIRHSAPATGNNYTTDMTVSDRSNRAVASALSEDPVQVETHFAAGGMQLHLQPGQVLNWTVRKELAKVTPVERDGAADDRECYRYDGGSQRILKVSTRQNGDSTQTRRTLYLPGLELRTTAKGDLQTESLQAMNIGMAGQAQVHVLHWDKGLPDGINNDQIRYSYTNQTGSVGLEVDGDGDVISREEYYPYGGTALLTARSQMEANYRNRRYSGQELDATGLYYYGYRYYQPWVGRWLCADPAGTVDGLNLFSMVRNNPITLIDEWGLITSAELERITPEILTQGPESIYDVARLGRSHVSSEHDLRELVTHIRTLSDKFATLADHLSVDFSIPEPSPEDVVAFWYLSDQTKFKHEIENNKITSTSIVPDYDSTFSIEFTKNKWNIFSIFRTPIIDNPSNEASDDSSNEASDETWDESSPAATPEQPRSDEPYYTSHVALFQYNKIATEQGFLGEMPITINIRDVENQATISTTEYLDGYNLFFNFFNNTPVGKSVRRIMQGFGLEAYSLRKNYDATQFSIGVIRNPNANGSPTKMMAIAY